MAHTAQITDYRGKQPAELQTALMDLRKEQMNLRFQKATGQLENPNRWRAVRKGIAMVKTALNEQRATTKKES